MDTLTKKLIDKATAYNQAASELEKTHDISTENIEFVETKETVGGAVRAFIKKIGFSSKYKF